jgi:hypothetical protein
MEPNREINREPVRESQKPRIDPAVLREEIFNVLSTLSKVKKEDLRLEDRLSEDLNLDSLARMEALELSIRQEMGRIAERLDAGDREFGKLRALRWKGVGALGAVGLIASLAGDHFWSGVRHLLGLK